ncbi:hypothetical protein TWF730_000385 [Orbilia blumenaviensis]|uniref:Uncharacterized protein n=1 Tax=Orbilia blumenaviensis TaxID=1796055 RepID=A0AAV9VLD7_9PEZI
MSQPSTDPDPLPERAAIPPQHLSRPVPKHQRKLSPKFGVALSRSDVGSGDGADDGGGEPSDGGLSRPAPAVIRPDNASSSAVGRNVELIAELERGPFRTDRTLDASPNNGIEQFTQERPSRNPYERTIWNKFTESLITVPYMAKISMYRTLVILWNFPDYVVRAKRRIFSPPPKPQTLPNPATVPIVGAAPKSPGRAEKALKWMFTNEKLQFYGFLFTLALNGAFGYWVWVHVNVYLDPHTWRLRRLVTSSLNAWTAFTSLEIWVAIMLGIWNLGGAYLILIGFALLSRWTFKYSGLKWLLERRRTKPKPVRVAGAKPSSQWISYLTTTVGLFFLILILWPILASTIPAPRSRIDRYPKRCEGGDWDFRVILDGRVNPANLTMGKVAIREMKGDNLGRDVVYLTEGYVNTTWMRTEEKVVLKRITIPPPEGGVYVSEVTYRFPYMETVWEKAGWRSLPDVKRERGGNYTVILRDSGTGRNETLNGRFPYLDDHSGLRLDEMALIPDVKRSWRTIASSSESCPWGPDAKLLENTDVTARDMAGEGYPVLLTDMTKFGRCAELTVCANRRRQVVDGLPWAVGEEGKKVLDAMLVVPLGLILVEQIRWGSCCGDGFEPYKARPP